MQLLFILLPSVIKELTSEQYTASSLCYELQLIKTRACAMYNSNVHSPLYMYNAICTASLLPDICIDFLFIKNMVQFIRYMGRH